jgi:hypothetical protein
MMNSLNVPPKMVSVYNLQTGETIEKLSSDLSQEERIHVVAGLRKLANANKQHANALEEEGLSANLNNEPHKGRDFSDYLYYEYLTPMRETQPGEELLYKSREDLTPAERAQIIAAFRRDADTALKDADAIESEGLSKAKNEDGRGSKKR